MLEHVKTPYIMLLDDDMIFTEQTCIEYAYEVLQTTRFDIVAGLCLPDIYRGIIEKKDNIFLVKRDVCRTEQDGFPV